MKATILIVLISLTPAAAAAVASEYGRRKLAYGPPPFGPAMCAAMPSATTASEPGVIGTHSSALRPVVESRGPR